MTRATRAAIGLQLTRVAIMSGFSFILHFFVLRYVMIIASVLLLFLWRSDQRLADCCQHFVFRVDGLGQRALHQVTHPRRPTVRACQTAGQHDNGHTPRRYLDWIADVLLYNLALAYGWWCSKAGKVTAGLTESNDRRVYDMANITYELIIPINLHQLRCPSLCSQTSIKLHLYIF